MRVDVRGDGIAAFCCVHLLRQAGIETRLIRTDRPRVPALLLSPPALQLLREIFERPSLLSGRAPILKRVVRWDSTQPVFEMEHLGVVTSEQELLSGLLPNADSATDAGDADWLVHCASPLPEGVTHERLGSRMATAWKVELRGDDAGYTCVMESLAEGWLFLLPVDAQNGWLLSVGDNATQVSESRVAVTRVARMVEASPQFPAHPRIASRLSGENWIACGSAAMAFDPICGDGTALALRAAILASAVIRAIAKGGDRTALLEHYESRVRAGFGRHVELCQQYYRKGFGGPWWDRELSALDPGPAYKPASHPFRYRLLGFDLAPVD